MTDRKHKPGNCWCGSWHGGYTSGPEFEPKEIKKTGKFVLEVKFDGNDEVLNREHVRKCLETAAAQFRSGDNQRFSRDENGNIIAYWKFVMEDD